VASFFFQTPRPRSSPIRSTLLSISATAGRIRLATHVARPAMSSSTMSILCSPSAQRSGSVACERVAKRRLRSSRTSAREPAVPPIRPCSLMARCVPACAKQCRVPFLDPFTQSIPDKAIVCLFVQNSGVNPFARGVGPQRPIVRCRSNSTSAAIPARGPAMSGRSKSGSRSPPRHRRSEMVPGCAPGPVGPPA